MRIKESKELANKKTQANSFSLFFDRVKLFFIYREYINLRIIRGKNNNGEI